MAAERRLSDIGMVSLLIVHQPTLREALEVLSEFRNRINSNLTLQIEEHGDTVFLREHFALNPPVVSRQVNDVALGVLYKLCRTLMGDKLAPAMRLPQLRAPAVAGRTARSIDRLFDCQLQFGSDFDGMVVETSDMARVNPRTDPALARHARELVGAMIDPGLRTTARGGRAVDPAADARRPGQHRRRRRRAWAPTSAPCSAGSTARRPASATCSTASASSRSASISSIAGCG